MICCAGWGDNRFRQVGANTTTAYVASPTKLQGLPKIVSAAAGDRHALALTDDGEVMAWGANNSGQLGIERAGQLIRSLQCSISYVIVVSSHLAVNWSAAPQPTRTRRTDSLSTARPNCSWLQAIRRGFSLPWCHHRGS